MATVDVILGVFRTYIDEPDQTFVPDTLVNSMLHIGYLEFRRKVASIDPNIYATTIDIAAPNSSQVDLSALPTPILGATAAPGDRLHSLVSLWIEDTANSVPAMVFNAAPSLEAVQSTADGYLFSGATITFNRQITRALKLTYVPGHDVQFTAAAGAAFVDDLDAFHDMISLYAYKQYSIADAATNQQVIGQLQIRERELVDYLSNRNTAGANYVQDVTSNEFWL